jgi:hypothetical protein
MHAIEVVNLTKTDGSFVAVRDFIVVVPTPYFATAVNGHLIMTNLGDDDYTAPRRWRSSR